MTSQAVRELRRSFEGAIIVAGDPGYEHARIPYNALIDRRPAAIARCASAADVGLALEFGRSEGLEIAVRGGGHNPAGHCVLDDGLVIDLSLMNRVEVEPEARVARAQGGATWLDFDRATQAHGLVTPGGVVGTTGVTGLTLGGGIGHLTSQLGLTCDGLLGADVTTPAGESVRAGDEGDAELLWGLRGGGGNFGIVTRIELRLHPLETVVGGRLVYSGVDEVAEALRRYRDLVAAVPRDLSCTAVLAADDALAPVLAVFPCYTGADSEPAWRSRLKDAPGLILDDIRRHSFIAQQHVVNPPYGVERTYWKGHFVNELPDELIDALVERMRALDRPPGQILIESLHGAPKDVDPASAALGFRSAAFNLSAMGGWLEPTHDEEGVAWTRGTATAMEPWSLRGAGYVNYMQADEPVERVRAAFGAETFERLQALKGRYDPHNVLRRNQNVPPAG